MKSDKIIQKLALERCRLNLSHLCAVEHMKGECVEEQHSSRVYIQALIEGLNKDFTMIEDMIDSEL